MAKACSVPTNGSDSGKYNLAKTSPVTVLYKKKSYHSIVVPVVLAITARRNCIRCSSSVSASGATPAIVIEAPPRGLCACLPRSASVRALSILPARYSCRSLSLAGSLERAHADLNARGGKVMPRIKHIALTTKEPAKVAAFYKDAFGMEEIRRAPNGAVFLTDGYINLAILHRKTEKSADVGPNGPNYSGIHHFGFEVDDLAEASEKLEKVQGERLTQKEGLDTAMAPRGPRNFEMKWAGPDGVVLDVSHTGWDIG